MSKKSPPEADSPLAKKGFSLVEILVVVGIFGVVLTIVFFSLSSKQAESRDLKRMSDINLLRNTLSVVKNETGGYDKSFCDLGAVSSCATKENSQLLKFIPDLRNLNDPDGMTACVKSSDCAGSTCNYAFTKLENEDYEIRFHLEKGVNGFTVSGCYLATPQGIRKL